MLPAWRRWLGATENIQDRAGVGIWNVGQTAVLKGSKQLFKVTMRTKGRNKNHPTILTNQDVPPNYQNALTFRGAFTGTLTGL